MAYTKEQAQAYNNRNRARIREQNREAKARFRSGGRAGIPAINDPRWVHDPVLIYNTIHVNRRPCWVLWPETVRADALMAGGKHSLPRVGLVMRPLDSYDSVQAIIPYEVGSYVSVCEPTGVPRGRPRNGSRRAGGDDNARSGNTAPAAVEGGADPVRELSAIDDRDGPDTDFDSGAQANAAG